MKLLSFILVLFLATACSTAQKETGKTTDIQPTVFKGGMQQYCSKRIKAAGLAVSERDKGLDRKNLIKSLTKTFESDPGTMALVRNAIYLAYEQPELKKSTLTTIETLRCTKFSSGYSDISDKEAVSNYAGFLECQSGSKDSTELYQCVLKIVWPNSKVKIGGQKS